MASEHPFGVPLDCGDFHCGRCGTILDGGTDEPVAARELRAEVAGLRAERDRYRQGLIDIARYEGWQSEAPAANAMGDIARQALGKANL